MLWLALLLGTALGGEERGKFKLTYFGKEAGTEEYRLESFDDGESALFSKAKFEVEVQGRKQAYLVDATLTWDKNGDPIRYVGIHKVGLEERQTRIEWKKGVAVLDNKKEIRTSAPFVLDNNVYSQLLPILRRRAAGRRKIAAFSPGLQQDVEVIVEEKAEVTLYGADREVRVREVQVTTSGLGITAYVDEKGRLVRAVSPLNGGLAELEGFEGLAADRRAAVAAPANGVEELNVTFPSGALGLAGSITKPKGQGKFPAILLISGSGPQDRNLNQVRGKGAIEGVRWPDWNVFKTLAYALSEAGILVLRYDDRGCGQSEGDFATARLSDLTGDVEAAVAFLRRRDDVGPIGLAGHSEGGLIAPIVAARDGSIKAVFLLAPPGKSLDLLLLEQTERAFREQGMKEEALQAMLARQRQLVADVKAAEGDYLDVDEKRTFIGWLREHFRHDPAAEIRKVKGRVVILQGMKDRQTWPDNAELLEKARPDAEVKRFEDLDHLFMKSTGKIGEYADPDRRVDAAFIKILVERVVGSLK